MNKKSLISMFMFLMLVVSAASVLGASDTSAYLTSTLLNQDPDPAEPGDYVELRFKIEKNGLGDLNDILFELEPDYPFSFDKTDNPIKELGSWNGFVDDDEQYVLYYKLFVDENAKEDDFEVKLITSYKSNGGESNQSTTFDVFVGDKKDSSFVVGKLDISPLELVSDSTDNKLSVAIENIGDGNAEQVVASIELPKGFEASYGYSDRSVLGNIEANGNKQAEFYIDVDNDVKSGVYDAIINLKYADESDEDNVYKQVEIPLEIPVHGQPQFEITSVSFVPETFSAGDSVEAHIMVKNTGDEEALGVSFRTFKESSQPFEFDDKSDFIGKLNSGDEGEAVITFTVDNDAVAKDFILDAEIRGVYNEDVFVDDGIVRVPVSDNARKSSQVSIVMAIVLAVFGIVVGFFFGRKRK